MSITNVATLRSSWRNGNLQEEINKAFDALGFTESYIAKLTADAASGVFSSKSKQIKDNQWGMIDFDGRAMRLIDCPLVQRLRYVKQLGFTYLTYPSAEHSRFSHTLGVGHVVSKFIEAINKRGRTLGGKAAAGIEYVPFERINGLEEDDLIHAALLHDIGHLPFSHVTEKILESRSTHFTCGGVSLSDFMFNVKKTLNINPKFSEVLTLAFILSDRFEKFYYNYVREPGAEAEEALLRIACLIVGIPPTPELSGLPQLISSASVDADKVDYVNRDALNCGVPVGVDVARIFLRSGVVRATRQQIEMLNLKEKPEEVEFLFVVNSSGIDTIDEILQARTALYQRVYFHAVTRTVERLLGISMEENVLSKEGDAECKEALALWTKKDVTLLDQLARSSIESVSSPALQISNRQFPRKAYSFSPSIVGTHVPLREILPAALDEVVTEISKQINNTTIEQCLRDEKLWKGDAGKIEASVLSEARLIYSQLQTTEGGRKQIVAIKGESDPRIIVVGTAHEKQKGHNQIICQNDRLFTLRDYSNAREQQDAYELLKEIGFVLCDEAWRGIVFFASRVVLARLMLQRTRAELRFNGDKDLAEEVHYIPRLLPEFSLSALRSGLPQAQIRQLNAALVECGYFNDKPWACEPVSAQDSRVRTIAHSLRRFEGYRSWSVTTRSVAAFVSQFPPQLRDPMLSILEHKTEYITTQRAVELLKPLLLEVSKPCVVVPFSPTSGNQIWTSLSKEIGSSVSGITFAPAVTETVGSGSIVFVDDNISSGTQACAQMLNFLGVPRCDWPAKSQAEDELLPELKDGALAAFKRCSVYLLFAAGKTEAEAVIRDVLKPIEGIDFAGVRIGTQIGADIDWPSELKQYLCDVGKQLMAWHLHRKAFDELEQSDREYCESRAFGYSNAGGMLVSSWNVPTSTITPLWQPGLYDGHPWMPLLIRTRRLKDLVVG